MLVAVGLASCGGGGARDAGPEPPDGGRPPRDAGADAGRGDAGPGRVRVAGGALVFDGVDDHLRIPRLVADSFTLEAWIETTASRDGVNFWEGLGLIYADVPRLVDDFGTSILGGRLAFGGGAPDVTVVSTSRVDRGVWVHVAAVRDREESTMSVVVDGALEASVVTHDRLLNAPESITIGGNLVNDRFFAGRIDEVRIWAVARTAAEIRETMHASLPDDLPGLAAYYRFDEEGSTARDSTATRADAPLGDSDPAAAPAREPSDAPIFR